MIINQFHFHAQTPRWTHPHNQVGAYPEEDIPLEPLDSQSLTHWVYFNGLQLQIDRMFFPQNEPEIVASDKEKTVFLYQNGDVEGKPIEFTIARKKEAFKDIKKVMGYPHLRLFNSEGVEYFEEDMQFVKNKMVLYASRGEGFDPTSCFGEYKMQKKLGEGGFGEVWLASHQQSGEEYAIKIIKTDRMGAASSIDGIFIEAETLKCLKHKSIVKIHNCLTLRNMKMVIIMEYLQGGELLEFVQKNKQLDEPTALKIIKQIVSAMTYCHSNGLIHRDLKLQNVLLVDREKLEIKVIDFGIAGVMKTMTWEDLDIGSLAYMAPECFVNTKGYQVDGRIDVWAVGVILYSMLVGELPFKGNTRQEAIEAIKQAKYKIPKQISKALSQECLDFLSQCLILEPKQRITMEQLNNHSWICGNLLQSQEDMESQQMQANREQPSRQEKKLKDSA